VPVSTSDSFTNFATLQWQEQSATQVLSSFTSDLILSYREVINMQPFDDFSAEGRYKPILNIYAVVKR